MLNMNVVTGIRYGIISAHSLNGDTVDELMYGVNATDVCYNEALKEFKEHIQKEVWQEIEAGSLLDQEFEDEVEDRLSDRLQDFNDSYYCEEPIFEGTLDGVKYRSTWLGGALHFWVFDSPITGEFVLCSPCVPNACDLDSPQPGGCVGYDVPADWRV